MGRESYFQPLAQPTMLGSLLEGPGGKFSSGNHQSDEIQLAGKKRSKKRKFKSLGPLWVEQGRGQLRISAAGKGVDAEN